MGIPYVEAEIQALNAEADRVGAPHLQVMHPSSQTQPSEMP